MGRAVRIGAIPAGMALLLAVGVAGCTGARPAAIERATPTALATSPSVVSPSAPISASRGASVTPDQAGEPVTFVAVVDGDTVRTSAGLVRLIGIDAPEQGECGHEEASAAIGRLLSAGDPATLVLPAGQNDRDQHDRLIRYVLTAGGVDLGLLQLQAGNAIARYDSTDGYPHHPRQEAYHAAQLAAPGPGGSVITTSCEGDARESATAAPGDPDDRWWRQYSSCTKLKKNTAGHPTGPFHRDDPREAEIYAWFAHGTGNRGDGDDDGLACE